MATFKVRVACDLYGSKHNAMFLFKPPPSQLSEVIAEVQRFYHDEATARKPEGHTGAAFEITALQLYDPQAAQWVQVRDVSQLTDGCQLYAFQQAQLQEAAKSAATEGEEATPQAAWRDMSNDGTREGIAFVTLDTKGDGVIDSSEMLEAFNDMNLRFTPNQVQDLFTVADSDRDGIVSRADFDAFAQRFPTVIDAIMQKREDEHVLAREEVVLADAQAALEAEKAEERRLLDQAAHVSQRVRDLQSQIADHKLSHEVSLKKKPDVDAQQQQLIEQELALAAQKERLRLEQENIRSELERQLNQVSESLGIQHPQTSVAAAPAQQPQAAALVEAEARDEEASRLGSISENSSSFFLPSDSPRHPGKAYEADDSLPPTPSLGPRLEVGAEVEACNFDAKPEFNGLRGKVLHVKDDGRVGVEFVIRGGLTLDMLPNNVKAVARAANPALGQEIEALGPAKGTAIAGPVDLRGLKGRVVGFASGMVLAEFPPKPGMFQVKPAHVVFEADSVAPAAMTAAAAAAAAAGVPSARDAQRVQEAVEQLLCQQQPCGTTPATCPESAGEAQHDMSLELAKARQEAEELRTLLAAQQTQQAQGCGQATRRQVSAATSPDARAALARLGQLGGHSPYISTAPASPMRFAAPDSVAAPPPALASPEPAAADPSVWSNGRHVRTVSPARRPPAGALPAAALLPSTQEILKRVGATFSPEGAAALGTPTQTPPVLSASGGGGAAASSAAFATNYHLGPIDPSTL